MNFWTMLHFACFIIYFIAFFYVVIKNPYSVANWVLGVLFIYFAEWSFCNSILYNTNTTLETAGRVIDIQSVGWSGFISFYLLFILFVTGRKKIISSPLTYIALICIPAMYVYQTFTGNMLVCCRQVDYGLTAQWKNNFWVFSFYIYYTLIFLAGTYVLVDYRIKTKNRMENRIADILIGSAVFCFVVGTLASVILKEMGVFVPIDANVAFVIFVVGFIYTVEKYEFLTNTKSRGERGLIENITEGFILTDKDGGMLSINPAALEILECSEEEIKKIFDGLSPRFKDIVAAVRSGRSIKDEEFEFDAGPGGKKIIKISNYPLSEQGDLFGYFCIISDITERRASEINFSRTEQRLKDIVESTDDWIWEIDAGGRCSYCSPGITKMLGYLPEEVCGKLARQILPESRTSIAFSTLIDAIAGKKPFTIQTVMKHKLTGMNIDIETKGTPFFDRKGNYAGFRGISRNVTERKENELKLKRNMEELRRSNDELEKFAYVASHDLKEPLRMVSSYVQLIKKRVSEKLDGSDKDFIQYATDGTTRMSGLIDDLLEYSRVRTKSEEFRDIGTKDALDEALHDLKLKIEDKNAKVKIDGKFPVVKADATQIRQLFQNLVENGLKFGDNNGPEISIKASPAKGGFYTFSVSDNGIGIEKQYHEKVFEIFTRLNSREDYDGNGIGLAICKKITERHGGRIWAESEGAGKGTVFLFTLPEKE